MNAVTITHYNVVLSENAVGLRFEVMDDSDPPVVVGKGRHIVALPPHVLESLRDLDVLLNLDIAKLSDVPVVELTSALLRLRDTQRAQDAADIQLSNLEERVASLKAHELALMKKIEELNATVEGSPITPP